MDTLEKIERIYSQIRAVNDEPSDQPGLERNAITTMFSNAGLSPPEAIVRLYQWHDGIYHLNAFLHFLPLSEALASYRSSLNFKREYDDAEWEPGWFPILDMNGSFQICVEVVSGAVFGLDTVMVRSWPIATSYEACLDAALEGLTSGALAFNERFGAFEATPAWRAIAAKHGVGNPW